MHDEKIVDELPAVARVAEEIPGRGDDKERKHNPRPEPILDMAPGDERRRERDRDDALGQHGESKESGANGEPACVAPRDPGERQQHCGGVCRGEREVRDAGLRPPGPHTGSPKDEGGYPAGATAELAAQNPPIEDEEGDGEKRDGEPWGEIGRDAEAEGGALEPVQERGFFKPGAAPEARRNPIAAARHFAADGGVARLVRAEQPSGAETLEID